MLNKHYVFVLFLLIISICAISSVSAADDIDDNIAAVEPDCDAVSEDDVVSDVLASADESVISQDESSEVLSASSPKYNQYTVKLYDSEISSSNGGQIKIHIKPLVKDNYHSYDFKLAVVEKYSVSGGKYNFENSHFIKQFTRDNRKEERDYTYTFTPSDFNPSLGIGNYYLVAVNVVDNTVMDIKNLKVYSDDAIQANDFTGTYGSNSMSVRVVDKNTAAPVSKATVNVIFSKGKTTVTKKYTTDSNGYIKFIPPVGIGIWTASFSLDNNLYKASSVKKTVRINRAPVKVKAYNVLEYKGFKITLKAKVTSNGKNVDEGTVKFKINGKTYKAAVKKGVATKKLKLKKVKKYKYTVSFSSNNHVSKKASAKAVMKKRTATKIVVKNPTVFSDSVKYVTIKIKTASGKKVKNGYIKLSGDSNKVKVKNGKVKVVAYGNTMKHLKKISGNAEYYKKYVTTKVKVKYIPSSHKYKPSTKVVKVKSKFRCPCGKTSTHNHYWRGYYYWHTTKIVVS